MLSDNIIFLRKNYPVLYEALKIVAEDNKRDKIIVEESQDGKKTLIIKNDGKLLYLHSKYNPVREAESIITNFERDEHIDDQTHVIFYGIGLGYHVDIFMKRFPNTAFSLYEPSVEVFNCFLDLKKIKNLLSKQMLAIQCEITPEAMNRFFDILLKYTDKKIIFMVLPAYQIAFKEQYGQFVNRFLKIVKSKRSSLNANYSFQKRWIQNSVINFNEILRTPNILMQNQELFRNKTAILVSAGPSLDYEIEKLRTIKENGLAYIFSVGSAMDTLFYNDIYPDAICTYDPTEKNSRLVFKKIKQKEIHSIPLIYGSSVDFEVVKSYKGPKYNMITTQDTISAYFLNGKDETQIQKINDAPSVALIALEMLCRVGFTTVILVGQNFGYLDKKNYAEGIDSFQIIDDETDPNIIQAIDVDGNAVSTCNAFIEMKNEMERYIKSFDDVEVINTTRGGVKIDGAEFISMDTLLKERLTCAIVKKDIFKVLGEQRNPYDKNYLQEKMSRMEDEYSNYKIVLGEIQQRIIKIKKNNNIQQISKMYSKIDVLIDKIEANDFFRVIAMPMNRVEYGLLVNNVQRIREEKNEIKKVSHLIPFVETFFNLLYTDIDLNEGIMEGLRESTENFVNNS